MVYVYSDQAKINAAQLEILKRLEITERSSIGMRAAPYEYGLDVYVCFVCFVCFVRRLEKLQNNMVGGERANDRELKEKRLKKKHAAEQRLNMLAKVLSKVEDEEGPSLVLRVYDDIQEELKAKTDLLRKYKQKVRREEGVRYVP